MGEKAYKCELSFDSITSLDNSQANLKGREVTIPLDFYNGLLTTAVKIDAVQKYVDAAECPQLKSILSILGAETDDAY